MCFVLLNIVHEYIVFKVYPFTFKGKALRWYDVLSIGTIQNWCNFMKVFENDYDEYYRVCEMHQELV